MSAEIHTEEDRTEELRECLRKLAEREVLVGVPEDTAARESDDGKPAPANNAQIAYWMETGVPSKNIPARPFLAPGIETNKDQIVRLLISAAQNVLNNADVEGQLARVGVAAANGIKRYMRSGVPPPLAINTIKARARSRTKHGGGGARKGAKKYLNVIAQGGAPNIADALPLIDTGRLRNSVTYVVL
jgi:hypothetical protein